ncbi:MAG: hypothetical protein ACRDKX_03295, partial [Solirubrobacterales bacterium]
MLGAAMVAAAALILWLDRATTFNVDQIFVVLSSPQLELREVFDSRNGHLGATTTLLYKGLLEAFGSGDLAFRIAQVAAALLAAGLFFALAKRRVGAVAALAPTLVLLFLGADWPHVATSLGFTVLFSIAAGLGSLLALERGDRRGDVAACVLLAISIVTFSTGLAFLVGVAISVLLRGDRWRRAWIFAVPAALYMAWWLSISWTSASGSDQVQLSNLLLIPGWAFSSLAAGAAALAGLAYDFRGEGSPEIDASWGPVLAVGAIVALALRIRRGSVPAALWAALGIAVTYWGLQALVADPGIRYPAKPQYVYPSAVLVLLVALAALAPIRPTPRVTVALFAIAAFSLAGNLALMRDGATYYREDYSAAARAQFAMLDLARPWVDEATLDLESAAPGAPVLNTPADRYFEFVDHYGSPALSLSELAGESEEVRRRADQILAGALGLGVEPALGEAAPAGCERHRGGALAAP